MMNSLEATESGKVSKNNKGYFSHNHRLKRRPCWQDKEIRLKERIKASHWGESMLVISQRYQQLSGLIL